MLMKHFAIVLILFLAGCALFSQDAEAEAILGDSILLIQKVNLCAEIDIEAISVSDSFPGAELFGDFVYWERPLSQFLADSCYWDYLCRPRHAFSGYDDSLRVKIALWRHGFMYCGVEGDTSSALFMLCNGGIGPVATWGRPLSWDDIYTDPFFTLDFSQNMLAQLIHHQYTKITDWGYIISGELPVIRDRMCLDPPTDSTGVHLYGFNLLAFSLKNNLDRTIWSVASQIATSRTDNIYSGSCWYAGIPVVEGPTGIVPFILNTAWCALCDDSTGLVTGTQSRGFSINYIAPEYSAIRMTGGSNNMTEAWGFLDGVERMYILNCCTRDYPRANYYSFGDFPDSVRMQTRLNRAAISSRFRMAVVADSVWFDDIWEDPSPGLSDNPSPLLLKISPGWNGKLYPEIEIAPTDTLDLGLVLVGESAIRSFTVNNIGDTTLIITTLASSNPDIFGTHYTVHTPAGESSLISVSFNPSSAGEFFATLAIYTNVPCKSLIYVHVRGKAVAVDPLVPYIVEPLPGTWTSCDDQPIIIGAICADTIYTESDSIRINSLPSTTEYFDSLSMEWVPAESVWSSAWGTTILPGTNWLWDSSFEREECIDFRVILNIPDGANIDSASISLHADNQATVFVNGTYVDTTHSIYWHRLHTFDIAPFLRGGSDTILIHACDISGVTAGLNFYVFVSYSRVCCRAVELSSVVLDVDSIFYHGGDGTISILDDTLIVFNPPEPFEDGDTVRVCLASAADTCGAIFRDLPLCWEFMVDLTPPVPTLLSPLDGATIMDSLPTISLLLHDSLTGLDTASVVFTVMGEETPVELIETDDGYLIEWTLESPVFHGDTVHFCVSATDTTDYCPDNILDTCFSFNIFSEGPVAELLSPRENAISACIDQNIIIAITDPEGIDPASIRLVVDNDTLSISDPQLDFIDGSLLIFTPSPLW
ncbi:MAG TPA: choice-of-anchor D domain-containing protein, partial [candidate division Zixibacteria bacterium]|nr:choice-of-anchor D domain-containing protein [candidate division Zixibacteria bacterium]